MRRNSSIALAFVLAVVGCTGRDGVHDAGDTARGLVRVDLAYTRSVNAGGTVSPTNGDARFDAQARFVRYRSFDPASVPTILGFADFDGITLDGCKVADGTAELDEALGSDGVAPEVTLLDAGHLELHGPADRATLMPRHYPELVPFVSGVIYGGDETAPMTLGLGQPYLVASDGGAEVGAFAASVTAPRAFPALSVNPLHRGSDLELRWTADAATGAEPLLIEVKWTSRAGARAVRCRARDDGAFSIPHDAFDGLPAASLLTSFSATATRVARSPLWAPGAGRGELTVALKDMAALQVAQ